MFCPTESASRSRCHHYYCSTTSTAEIFQQKNLRSSSVAHEIRVSVAVRSACRSDPLYTYSIVLRVSWYPAWNSAQFGDDKYVPDLFCLTESASHSRCHHYYWCTRHLKQSFSSNKTTAQVAVGHTGSGSASLYAWLVGLALEPFVHVLGWVVCFLVTNSKVGTGRKRIIYYLTCPTELLVVCVTASAVQHL